MTALLVLAGLVGIAAVAEDLYCRTISNWTTAAAALGGVLVHCVSTGWEGLASSLLGLTVGFIAFLVFYLLGGMGGGDVKLMAGFGAILGAPHLTLQAVILTAAIGGLLALFILAVRCLRSRLAGSAASSSPFIPYAPAITAGAWLTLFSQT